MELSLSSRQGTEFLMVTYERFQPGARRRRQERRTCDHPMSGVTFERYGGYVWNVESWLWGSSVYVVKYVVRSCLGGGKDGSMLLESYVAESFSGESCHTTPPHAVGSPSCVDLAD